MLVFISMKPADSLELPPAAFEKGRSGHSKSVDITVYRLCITVIDLVLSGSTVQKSTVHH